MKGRRPDPARRAALRARLAAAGERRRLAFRARRTALRSAQAGRAARRAPTRTRRRWLLLLLLLLPCFLPPCPPPPEVAEAPPAPAAAGTAPAGGPRVAPPPPPARVARRERPAFVAPAAHAPPWLDSFRLQVAARSPRLAACFDGADRPGALKWSAAVEPVHGLVADPTLTPTLAGEALSADQQACLLDALADPPYRLAPDATDPTPVRVSLVVEF